MEEQSLIELFIDENIVIHHINIDNFKEVIKLHNKNVELLLDLASYTEEIEECCFIDNDIIESFTYTLKMIKSEIDNYTIDNTNGNELVPLSELKQKNIDTYKEMESTLDAIQTYESYNNIATILNKVPYSSKLTIYDIVDACNNGYQDLIEQLESILDQYDIDYIADTLKMVNETKIVAITNRMNTILKTKFNNTLVILVLLIIEYELYTLTELTYIIVDEKQKILNEFQGYIDNDVLEYIQGCTHTSHLMNYNILLAIKFTGKCEDGKWPESSIQYDISNSLGREPLINTSIIQKMNLMSVNEINGISINNLVMLELLRRVIIKYMDNIMT